MPPPVRQGAPPAYATRFMNSHPFFAYGQPLHTGSFQPFFATLLLLPLIVIPMGMTAQIWLQTSDERNVITKEDLDKYHFQVYVIKVLDIVAALVSIPLVSLLLSHAAVACAQRSSKGQTLSLYQLAALANRRWLDLTLPSIYFSPFSVGATLLIVLTFINIPLRSILIPSEARLALVCEDRRPWRMMYRRTWYPACGNQTTIGWEPAAAEPDIDRDFGPAEDDTDPIIQAIIGGLETVRQLEYADRGTGYPAKYPFWPDTRAWASSVSPDAHTGMIRQHALRYNSSANCESVLPADFPAECDLENSTAFLSSFVTESLTLRVCILSEGSQRFSQIRDAQDITEIMYLSAQGISERGGDGEYYNEGFDEHDLGDSTVRCTGTTTRGYFELGSNHNKGRPSNILKEWPSEEVMEADFSDFSSSGFLLNWRIDDRMDGKLVEGSQVGPMLKVAKALFGPSSYFSRVTELYNTTRETTTYRSLTRLIKPLSNYDFSTDPASTGYESMYSRGMSFRQSSGSYSETDVSRRVLADTAHALVNGFARSNTGTRALSAALHIANDAFLTSLRGTDHPHREIVRYQGQNVLLPRASLAGFIVALVLLCIQVVLIIALWMYINFKPTWTNTLDAMAMMKLGAHLQGRHEFPPLGKTNYVEDDKFLKNADGLVGLVTHGDHLPATADLEMAVMTPQPQGMAAAAAPPPPAPAADHEEATPQTTQPTAPLPQFSVEDTDANASPAAGRPLHRRVSLSSIGPAASPPPSYYGSDLTTEEVVPKGPYTIAVGGLGILDRGLYSRHRPK